MFYYPRFSYTVSKSACTGSVGWRTGACAYPSRHGVLRPGRVGRVGIPGEYYPATQRQGRTPLRVQQTAERAPEAPAGGWSGWSAVPAPVRPHPPFGPGQSRPAGLPWCSSSKPASWPIRARIDLIYCKVSQNRIVSPVYVEKAYVSPYFQNGSEKSALEIPGFPFWRAFSHKELMGYI